MKESIVTLRRQLQDSYKNKIQMAQVKEDISGDSSGQGGTLLVIINKSKWKCQGNILLQEISVICFFN